MKQQKTMPESYINIAYYNAVMLKRRLQTVQTMQAMQTGDSFNLDLLCFLLFAM